MTLGTDASIFFFGTQDEVTTGTPGTVADGAFSVAADVDSTWTNDDDAPFGAAVLKLQFDSTAPTVGSVGLYARLLDIQSTNDDPVPDANVDGHFVGSFKLDFGVAIDVDYHTSIPFFTMPMINTSQIIEWYIKNENTGETIGADWELYITPIAFCAFALPFSAKGSHSRRAVA